MSESLVAEPQNGAIYSDRKRRHPPLEQAPKLAVAASEEVRQVLARVHERVTAERQRYLPWDRGFGGRGRGVRGIGHFCPCVGASR